MLRWFRRIALTLVALVAALAGCIAFIYFFGSSESRNSLAHLYAIAAANHSPPPIARSGVTSSGSDWMMPEPASTKFTAVLREHFPPGSSASEMRTVLAAQGFGPRRTDANAMEYQWGAYPCIRRLTVRWTAD